jgi:hypothetical protein
MSRLSAAFRAGGSTRDLSEYPHPLEALGFSLPSPSRGEGTFIAIRTALAPRHARVNIGTGGPPSEGRQTSRTALPMAIAAKSQSTRLVSIRGPSSSVT